MKRINTAGMTLMEIMISVLLAAIVFAAVAAALAMGLSSIKVMRESSAALQVAQAEIEKMRNTTFGSISTHSFAVPALGVNGSVVAAPEGSDSKIKRVTVNVAWTSGGRPLNVSLVTYMTDNGINRK